MLKLQIPINSIGDLFEFKLAKEKVAIGRRHDNDIRIKETYVSAYHAELSLKDDRVYLRDRDSSNGTFLNGNRVREKVEVLSGDVVKFGSLKCYIADLDKKVGGHSKAGKAAKSGNGSTQNVASPPVALRNKTAAVSAKSDQNSIGSKSSKGKNSIPLNDDVAYTSPIPGPNLTHTQPIANMPGQSDEALALELEELKKQLAINRKQMGKAKDELKTKSAELANIKTKSEKESASKQKTIKSLEKRLKAKDSSNDDLDHRLRLAKNRVDQLESELEHHKTDMSAEIKAAMQRLTHTKNDNVLLQTTMDALESERNDYRDKTLDLARKLEKTREGFSFFLHNSGTKLEKSHRLQADLEKDHEKTMSRMRGLEDELDSLRDDFSKMEADYQQRLKKADKEQKRVNKSEQTLSKDLESANETLINQKAEIVKLEATLESVVAEKEAAEEDWSQRIVELKETNQKLVGYSKDLNILEKKIDKSTDEVDQLRQEKAELEEDTEDLRRERATLVKETKSVTAERDESTEKIAQVREESKKVSHKLDTMLQNLHESEKKVTYLRGLEYELEKSVLRAQRSALSRKGIYREEDEESYTTIWPETEQMICRELIDRMELLEDLLKRYQQSWFFPKVADQLNLLRDSFMALLKNHSVDQFDLEPGTELSVDSRKKIQLISVDDLGDSKLKRLSKNNEDGNRTRVLQTLRPGYIYSKGGEDVIIRKAEVIVA